jgi:hypothetical protein
VGVLHFSGESSIKVGFLPPLIILHLDKTVHQLILPGRDPLVNHQKLSLARALESHKQEHRVQKIPLCCNPRWRPCDLGEMQAPPPQRHTVPSLAIYRTALTACDLSSMEKPHPRVQSHTSYPDSSIKRCLWRNVSPPLKVQAANQLWQINFHSPQR